MEDDDGMARSWGEVYSDAAGVRVKSGRVRRLYLPEDANERCVGRLSGRDGVGLVRRATAQNGILPRV